MSHVASRVNRQHFKSSSRRKIRSSSTSATFSLYRADNKTPGDIHIYHEATKPPPTFLISVCRDDQTAVMCSRGKLTNARGMSRLCFSFPPVPAHSDTYIPSPLLSLLTVIRILSLSSLSVFLVASRRYTIFFSTSPSLPSSFSLSLSFSLSKFHVQLEGFCRS